MWALHIYLALPISKGMGALYCAVAIVLSKYEWPIEQRKNELFEEVNLPSLTSRTINLFYCKQTKKQTGLRAFFRVFILADNILVLIIVKCGFGGTGMYRCN